MELKKTIIVKLERKVAMVCLPKSSSYHWPFFLRALTLISALNSRTTSNQSAQKVLLPSHLLAHCTPPSPSRDCIGQDINGAICSRTPPNSGLCKIDVSFFLYIKAQADMSALACEVISSPGFFPPLCCYPYGGLLPLCAWPKWHPVISTFRSAGSKGWDSENHPPL